MGIYGGAEGVLINNKGETMSCECQNCGDQYKVDFIIQNELWEEIKPSGKGKGGGMLCGSCICQKIEEKREYNSFNIIET